jgi:tetratricopeptide (TPR) repeat protein
MYKRKFREWGWRKYEHGIVGRNPGGEPSVVQPVKGTRGKDPGHSGTKIPQPNSSRGTTVAASTPLSLAHVLSPSAHPNSTLPNNPAFTSSYIYPAQYTGTHFNLSMTCIEALQSHSSHGITVAGFTPPHNHHARFHPIYSGIGIPASISINVTELMDVIIAKTEDLYIKYLAQGTWLVNKQREVEEDIHDDLLVGIATSVRNYSSLSPDVGDIGFQKALLALGKVVGVGDGADCGLFSLPAIWVSFLRLVRGQRPVWASRFLSVALNLARTKFGRKHSLVQVLDNLKSVWEKDPGQVEQVVLRIYRRCISQVKERLGPFNLTYLSLWADYVVYLDGTSDSETYDVVENIRGVIKVVEEEKGKDGGPDSDYVIELNGMMLYVLQSAPTTADEAEDVAKELLERLKRRKKKAGEKLEGDLFTTWKDLRQTLGTFCQRRGDYEKAIGYLEESLTWEIVDERDVLALEKLERCYLSVGRDEQAKVVWQRRMDESQRLLQKADAEPARGEKVADDHGEGDDKEGGNVSDEGGSSEGTVVCQVEEINEENLGEYNDDEIGDSEVEQQLLREQIAELTKRLNVLEMGKGKGAKIMT